MSTLLPAGQFVMPTTYHFIISVGESSTFFFQMLISFQFTSLAFLIALVLSIFSVTFMLGNATVSKGHHSPF